VAPVSAQELTCPFCDSTDVETVGAWGGQLITRQMRCRACKTHFEALRDEFDGARLADSETSWTSS
jgi:transcriptional regulator NrdR family protein